MTDHLLPIVFFFVSLIYSSVGLGGGSSYTAIMSLTTMSYKVIPTTSLSLNLVVSFFGMLNFWRFGHGRLNLVLPFLLCSMPIAYLSGSIMVSEFFFQIILLTTLLLIVIRIYIIKELSFTFQLSSFQKWSFIIIVGAFLGFIAGTIGIGGGIYLIPLIIMLGLGTPKEAAAAGATFVWLNSLVGLAARSQVVSFDVGLIAPMVLSVILGGSIGSYYGSTKYDSDTINKIMGMVILVAILLLVRKMS